METVGGGALEKGAPHSPVTVWPPWYAALTSYQKPSLGWAAFQLATSVLPYVLLWYLMIRTVQGGYPYALTLLLALLAAAFLVRVFILFHDCVHGSFFSAPWANTLLGYFCGILTFTAFEDWRFTHLRHHVSYADLDARGFGDIWTMTLTEFNAASPRTRLLYRLYRHPLVLLGLGAAWTFVFGQRLPTRHVTRKERASVLFTNVLLGAVVLGMCSWIGWRTYLKIQLPVIWLAGVGGIWLFYVQHQFEGVYWARRGEWNALRAAMEGSSFYDLPPLLRFFSGSIGYHHVHHLRPRIPNYRLQECFAAVPALREKKPLHLRESFSSIGLKLWDEERGKLVGFP